MVFVMKYIVNYVFYILTVTFLFALVISINSHPSLLLVSQDTVYATNQEQQEDLSSENNDGSPVENEDSGTTQDNVNSEQSEESNSEQNSNDDSYSSSSDQSNTCPDTKDFANVPTYIGEDGCLYPCISLDKNGQGNNPESCPVELPLQSSSGFSINEERPIQSQPQTTQEPQQNTQTNPSQSTLVSPRIDSDTTATTLNNIPNTEITTTTAPTQKSFSPAGKYKPGSGQTELSIPGKSDSFARPYTPGAGNTQAEGIPSQPNTNPQTPIDPGNIPTTIPDKAHLTVITKMMNFYTGFLKVSDFEICVQSTIQTNGNSRTVDAIPRCANGSSSGVQYTVQAPGSITIWVDNLDELGVQSLMIETPNLSNYINAYESKTSTIYISPYHSEGP
jgi:hypothetical protein